MVFVHAFAGASLAALAVRNKKLSDKQKSIIYALGIIGSIFPDFDLTLLILKIAEAHRYFLTHSAVPYTVAILIWLVFTRRNDFLRLCGVVFYFGILSHLGLDMLTGGLVALAPFTYKIYGFPLPVFHSRSEWSQMYLRSTKYLGGEAAILVFYLYLLKNEKNKIAKLWPWIFSVCAALMVLVLLKL